MTTVRPVKENSRMGVAYNVFLAFCSLMLAIQVAMTWYQGGSADWFVWTGCILYCVGVFLDAIHKIVRPGISPTCD